LSVPEFIRANRIGFAGHMDRIDLSVRVYCTWKTYVRSLVKLDI
jgi:hypothetical protein